MIETCLLLEHQRKKTPRQDLDPDPGFPNSQMSKSAKLIVEPATRERIERGQHKERAREDEKETERR